MPELVTTTTSDGRLLPGGLYSGANAETCIVFIHGRSCQLIEDVFAQRLAIESSGRGITFLYGHTRGYGAVNTIARTDGSFERNGSVYERWDGVARDVYAWVSYARNLGYEKLVLMGHSLGGPKVLSALQSMNPAGVIGVVLASPVDMVALGKHVYGKEYSELVQRAREAVRDRRPDTLVADFDHEWPVSAGTFLDQHLDRGMGDVLPIQRQPQRFRALESLRVPTLVTYGEAETDFVVNSPLADGAVLKAKAPHAPNFHVQVIAGGDHLYSGAEATFAAAVTDWTIAVGAHVRDVAVEGVRHQQVVGEGRSTLSL